MRYLIRLKMGWTVQLWHGQLGPVVALPRLLSRCEALAQAVGWPMRPLRSGLGEVGRLGRPGRSLCTQAILRKPLRGLSMKCAKVQRGRFQI
jgi:hypothetical protein